MESVTSVKRFSQIIIALFFLTHATVSVARLIAAQGNFYDVAEKDALLEIKDAARLVDWKSYMEKAVRAGAFQVEGYEFGKNWKIYPREGSVKVLPHTEGKREFEFTPKYTLPFDIIDDRGNVIYPKGFTYNPLDYIEFPWTLVVIDGSDADHCKWALDNWDKKPFRIYIFSSTRACGDMEFAYENSYFLLPDLAERLRLEHTPSVVTVEGNKVIVKEYVVPEGYAKRSGKKGSKR